MSQDNIITFIAMIRSAGMEVLKTSDNRLVVFSAKEIPEDIKNDLCRLMPGSELIFYVGIKPSTREALSVILSKKAYEEGISMSGFPITEEEHRVKIDVPFEVQSVWADICRILKNDGYPVSWTVGDMTCDLQVLEALETNPKRDRVITSDDCMDVKILVNACKTVEDFLSAI